MRAHGPDHRGHRAILAAVLCGLTGCAHKDAVDTAAGWWHGFEGGVIAKERPPPPGAHAPYPHVGLTPTKNPEMPSPAARVALTERLQAQRNYGQLMAAQDGILPSVASAKPAQAANDINSGLPSAVSPLGSPTAPHDTTPAAPPKQTPGSDTSGSGSSMSVSAPAASNQPSTREIGMPAVTEFAPPPIRPGELPQIGTRPPPAPRFPGFDIPEDAFLADRPGPAFDTSEPHGTLIRFAQSSDQLMPGQDGTFSDALKTRTTHGAVYVTGFGDAASLTPDDQAASLRLALLRARVLAQTIMLRGVQADSIHISARVYGHGARLSLTP